MVLSPFPFVFYNDHILHKTNYILQLRLKFQAQNPNKFPKSATALQPGLLPCALRFQLNLCIHYLYLLNIIKL